MKKRPNGFIAEEMVSHDSEIFDYIAELHDYLWQFVRLVIPGASGKLDMFVDIALEKMEKNRWQKKNLGHSKNW